jgi:hypothetical protein
MIIGMFTLNDREKYCLGLVIVTGGDASFYDIRDYVIETPSGFEGLNPKYLRYSAVKKVLRSLVKKKCLSEKDDVFEVNPLFELGFIQKYPVEISKAIKSVNKYRKNHILEFETICIEDSLLNPDSYGDPPYDIISNLTDALELHRNGNYDSVLVKCGKCVELMITKLNEDYQLFDNKITTGNMIGQLQNKIVCDKIEADKDDLRTFAEGVGLVYRFRNIMGAHANPDYGWEAEQVATSCLILTLYLADSYFYKISK